MTFLAFTALQTHRPTAFIVIKIKFKKIKNSHHAIQTVKSSRKHTHSNQICHEVMKQVRHCKHWAFV